MLQHIIPADESKPRLSYATEAGLLCKSGINSSGVAVFLNAISQSGISFEALPIHIALRTVLESTSVTDAVSKMLEMKVGTSGNMLIADQAGSICLEFTHADAKEIQMRDGQIAHTNHFLEPHCFTPTSKLPWPDTIQRMQRVTHLLEDYRRGMSSATDGVQCLEHILEDEDGFPTSINRCGTEENGSATLFSIVADLNRKTACLRLGRPSQPDMIWKLSPTEL